MPHCRTLMLFALLLLAACGSPPVPRAAQPVAPVGERMRPSGVTAVPAPQSAATRDPRSLGDPEAPITVYAFSDFQCPFCASFVRETMPLIKAQYIDTGKVYFVYRDLPLQQLHPGAIPAAHAAGCAAEQNAFWPMHDRLFQGAAAQEWGSGTSADLALFLGYARDLGLDQTVFEECIRSNRRAAMIEDDTNTALSRGFQSTPAFMINGQPLIGAQPFAVFQRAFDQILAAN